MAGEARKAGGKPARRSKDGGDQADALYTSDVFRMYCYKVLPCTKSYNHNWKVCPFAHEGEKARRRDPRTVRYVGIECPDSKSGRLCPRGEACPFAHNVFEYWLHPTRYRTQLCNEPATCRRKVCFFAHMLQELRKPSLEEFVMMPAGRAADEKGGGAGGPQVVRATGASGALEAAAKAQEALAQQQASLRMGMHGGMQPPSPYENPFDQSQQAFQMGDPSLGGGIAPTPMDDALKDLAAWFGQQNGAPSAPPALPRENGQAIRLLTMLQELIKTQQQQQQGGEACTPNSGSSGSRGSPSLPQQFPSGLLSRLSMDGLTSALQGQLSLGANTHVPQHWVQATAPSQAETPPARPACMHVQALPERQGLLWGHGRPELRKRLSLDSHHGGRQF